MRNAIDIINLACIFVVIFILTFSDISYAQDYGIPDSIIVGNLDRTSVQASPGDTVNIPVWLKNDENIGAVSLPIAAPDQFIAEWTECTQFGQLATWPTLFDEDGPVEDEPYIGHSTQYIGGIYVHLVDPNLDGTPVNTNGVWTKITEYTCIISSDESNIHDSTQFIQGFFPPLGSFYFDNDTESAHWIPVYLGGYLKVVHPGYEYRPGDVNMYVGSWPPVVTGPDVTYLVNYFRGVPSSVPCFLDGFWASADANGSCTVIGSDVTKLLYYFGGKTTLLWCPDYPPLWPSQLDVPPSAPPGWPNCD